MQLYQTMLTDLYILLQLCAPEDVRMGSVLDSMFANVQEAGQVHNVT